MASYNWLGTKTLRYLLERIKSKIPTKLSQLQNDAKYARIEDNYWSEDTVYSSSKTRSLIPIGMGSASQPIYFDWNGQAQCGYKETKTALGLYANAQGYNSIAIGMNCNAIEDNVITIGYQTLGNGESGIAIGYTARTNLQSISIGKGAESENKGVAIGSGTKAAPNSVAIGTNASTKKGQVFAVGDSSEVNAFDIRQGTLRDNTLEKNIKLEPGGMYHLIVTAYDTNGFFYGATSREFVAANDNAYWWKPCTEIRANNVGNGGYSVSYPQDSSVTIKANRPYIIKYSLMKIG